ncbi:hypothetical protein K9853_15485, partial [Lacticaseibacillus paracasei]|uniref:hypothetical protein n=1 Tax=Lacticaseibacillus paracasei TaxID=1597 RepID=UPI001EDD1FF0
FHGEDLGVRTLPPRSIVPLLETILISESLVLLLEIKQNPTVTSRLWGKIMGMILLISATQSIA